MSASLVYLLILALMGSPPQLRAQVQVPLDQSDLRGNIEIEVVNSFGEPLPGAVVYIQRLKMGEASPNVKLKGHVAGPNEYGKYRITAEEKNHGIGGLDFDLRQPTAVVVIGLVPHAIEESHDHITVKGVLKHAVSPGCVVIRLTPLFAAHLGYDAKIYRDQFTIVDAKPGRYASVVLGTTGVCSVSEVRIGLGVTFQSVVVE